ncbi:MAG: TerB family tellurite resistance protein [Trichocoleus desertorum ATA4-8-CV12]|nr:TerB family tellurite resistance protein [Trichocoleus desertorum ATA4-8-CV12]
MPTQPPPSITPRQMNLLRAVVSMAWSDGHLATEEIDLILDQFSRLFATDPKQQQKLQQELRDYLIQNIPLEEIIPKLDRQEERELVLRLGYEVIRSSARTPNEPEINEEEATAYERLKSLLNLSSDVVQRVEAEAETSLETQDGIVELLVVQIQHFING